MKKLTYTLFSLILFACSIEVKGQSGPAVIAQKCLGGSRNDIANDVLPLPDGGFLVVGSSNSNDGDVTGHHGSLDSSDAWVCRLNADLSIRWQRSYGGTGVDEFRSVALMPDGSFACFGTSSSFDGDVTNNHGMQEFWLARLNENGNILWNRLYGGNGAEILYDGILTSDGGFALIGTASSYEGADVSGVHGYYGNDVWVVRTNASGTPLWKKVYGNDGYYEYGTTIVEDDKHDLIAFVRSNEAHPPSDFSLPANGYESLLMKVSGTDGTILAQTLLQGRFDEAGSLAKSPTGFIANVNASVSRPTCWDVSGNIGRFDASLNPVGTLITTPSSCSPVNGTTMWTPLALTHGMIALDDSTWLGVGTLFSYRGPLPASDTSNGVLVTGQFRQDGNRMQWSMYGGSKIDQFNSIRARSGSYEFIVAGMTYSNEANLSGNHGGGDAWVVRLGRSNQVQGTVFVDRNGNGVRNAGEPDYDHAVVSISGEGRTLSTLPVNGTYGLSVDTGAYVTTIDLRSSFYTVQPVSRNSNFQGYEHIDQVDFAVAPIPGKKDVAVDLIPVERTRPGSTVNYLVRLTNNGTDTLSGNLLTFIKDHRTTLSATAPTADRVQGDTLYWDRLLLYPGIDSTIQITLVLGIPPVLGIGDTLQNIARVDDTNDLVPSDNNKILRQPVRASFDPNEKTEAHSGTLTMPELQAGTRLQYKIEFQNTGNDTAFQVIVRDTLPLTLNASSVEVIHGSHQYKFNIREGNILEWTFPNILLPDSTTNASASHGQIVYSVLPVNGLAVGSRIDNRASIYFDYAPPVRTEIARTVLTIPGRASMDLLGTQANYCRLDTLFYGKLRVQPAGSATSILQVRLDTIGLPIGIDSTVRYDMRKLTLGSHAVTTVYQDVYGKDSTVANFTIVPDSTATLGLQASATQVSDTDPNLIITATALTGGGAAPKFQFSKGVGGGSLLQAISTKNSISIDPKTLAPGVNWIRVDMVSSGFCVRNGLVTDSIQVTRNTITGLYDPDLPGSNIIAYPNPLSGMLAVKGLSTMKSYIVQLYNQEGRLVRSQKVAGQASLEWNVDAMAAGTYFLRVTDERKHRSLGTLPLIKQ